MTVRLDRLANGFRVVTEAMPGLKSASVGVWVNVGGRHERLEQNGIAHFLEHMAFKGTSRRSARDIAEAIEDVGGYINAYTSRETTAYYARVLGQDVDLALDVISDIVLNPVFDPREVEIERGVILQEIGQALDTPDDIVFDWLQETAYPDQPFGRTILGPADRVSAFTADDLRAFVGANYGPAQMILAAAGEVDHDRIMAFAQATFGALPMLAEPHEPPARFAPGEHRNDRALEQAHFALALEAPGYLHDDVYTAQIHSIALGGGMSSRLFQEIRENRGLCYAIHSHAGAYRDTGTLTIYAGTGGEDVAELSGLVMDELRKTADGFTQAELDRARAQIKAGLLMGLESPSARAERLARNVAVFDRVPDLSELVAKIEAVDLPRLRSYAEGLVGGTGPALALYGPVSDAPDVATLAARMAA